MVHRSAALGLSLIALLVAGCEQKTAVSGKVTYNGEPVNKGAISFRPTGGAGQSFGAMIKDGAFEVPQAKEGSFTAVVAGAREIDFAMSSAEAAKKASERKIPAELAGHVSQATGYIAEDAEGNSKQVDVTGGSQTIDFDIKGPPK